MIALLLASAAMTMATGHEMMPGMVMPAPPKSAVKAKPKPEPRPKPKPRPAPVRTPAPRAAVPAPAMPDMPGMEMPGHDMGAATQTAVAPRAIGTDLPAGTASPPPVPTDHAADGVYGGQAMAMGRHHLDHFHGGQKLGMVMINLAEVQLRKGRNAYEWNGQAWYGGDLDRFVIKSEGGGGVGQSVGRAEVQGLLRHAITPTFNLEGGVRYDFKPNPSRAYATVGVEGLAPYFIEVEAALFLSTKGELLARIEASHDERITQRLILQPRIEVNAAAQDSRSIGIGAGLSDAEIGLRLRYEIRREFAPYVGVQWERAFGATRRFRRAAVEDDNGWRLVTGIRAWF